MHSVLHAFTHSVVWASVIASAFVAAVITLLIEYLAKPQLEARKDRILEYRRQQRAALNDMKRCFYLANRLVLYEKGVKDSSIPPEQFQKALAEFAEIAITPYGVIDPPEKVSREWADTMFAIHRYAVTSDGRLTKDVQEKFAPAFVNLEFFHSYFSTAKWHLWRRRKLIKRIKWLPPSNNFKAQASEENTSLPY